MKTIAHSLDISLTTLLAPACHGPTDIPGRPSTVPFEANIVILNAEIVPTLCAQRSSLPLSKIGLSSQTSDITFHSFEFGDRLKVFGISAEICWP